MRVELTVNEYLVERTENVFEVQVSPIEQTVEINKGTLNLTYDGTQASVTAAEALSGHRAVTIDGYYADKDTAGHKFKVLGVTQGAVSLGSTAVVTTFGEISNVGWSWTVGSPVFLSTTGHLTQTAPTSGFRTIIGRPITATSLFVDISEPIAL